MSTGLACNGIAVYPSMNPSRVQLRRFARIGAGCSVVGKAPLAHYARHGVQLGHDFLQDSLGTPLGTSVNTVTCNTAPQTAERLIIKLTTEHII